MSDTVDRAALEELVKTWRATAKRYKSEPWDYSYTQLVNAILSTADELAAILSPSSGTASVAGAEAGPLGYSTTIVCPTCEEVNDAVDLYASTYGTADTDPHQLVCEHCDTPFFADELVERTWYCHIGNDNTDD